MENEFTHPQFSVSWAMKVERIHKSRKAAAQYLIARGWIRRANSFGDWVFTHLAKSHRNIIVALRNGTWEIQAWG